MQRAFAYFAAFTGMGALFAGTLLLAAIVLGVGQASGNPGASSGESAAPSRDPNAPIGTIEVHAFDLGFDPNAISVAEPGIYTVRFVNDGGTLHDITFADGTKVAAEGHAEATGTITIPAAGMTFLCSIPGHSDAGMKGNVLVDAGHSHEASASPAESMTPLEMLEHDAARTGAFPAETVGRGNVVLEPTILADGTKEWELTASAFQWETEPGVTVEAWGYNEMVPGPQLRAQVGDRIRIILHNELPVPTTIHSHGLIVPNEMDGVPAINQTAVLPGETFVYEYTLRNAGSHMYHSHFMAQKQVPMGLLGAFVVTDPNDSNEYASDVDYTMILNDGPLGFTINGKSFPATEPIVATQGEVVRIRYMNEGLQIHPMHLHGIPQLVIAQDGYLLPDPHYEDTVLIAPGQRVDVLVDASELGVWAFHCHVLTHAEGEDGMFGMVTALIVQEP